MKNQKLTTRYMVAVILIGEVCVGYAIATLPWALLDLKFFFLAAFTVGIASRMTVQIPKFKSHISVSDTFIFLALVLYGGEAAVLLAATEAFFSAWRFCTKKITVFFNSALMAVSTTLVVSALRIAGITSEEELHGHHLNDFIVTFSLIAFVQYFANTGLSSIYGALKSRQPWWETWKTHYLWIFLTYSVGSFSAGVLVIAIDNAGFAALGAAIPIILFVYFTYRMYLKNVEMSLTQAEQAKEHAEILEKQSIALSESEERFRSAFNYAPIGIALVSPTGNWLKVNKALCQILGYTDDEFLATDFQSMIVADDLGNTLIKVHELLSQKSPTCQMEQRYTHKDGTIVWTSWSASTVSDANGGNPNLVFQIQDITDKKQAEQLLHYKATHDPLTGLPNRAFFLNRLEEALAKSAENPLHKVSILFIDLDRFKVINDSLGHLVGDQLLVGISERLRDCLRPTDLVARLGGDEFTILVEGGYDEKEVVGIAERIQEKFQIPFNLKGHEVYSSASIGILNRNDNHRSPEEMMRDADTAMYHAKRLGKARHEIFDQDMHEAVKQELKIETDLRRAVDRNEIAVYYQPIFSLETNQIEGFEALARWDHPTLGTVEPARFIALAEEIGLIDVLGEQMMRLACSEIVRLYDISDEYRGISLSVNLSCRQFGNPKLYDTIRAIIEDTRFPADRLKLEITESVFFEHQDTAIPTLNGLRAIGVEINIDDFGTGYSNLNYLRKLPISTLKIDRSFIGPITEEGGNVEIIQTIILLAHNLGMRVIAEGVETETQLEQLRILNCEAAQGYLFAPPLPFDELPRILSGAPISEIVDAGYRDVSILSTIQ